MHLGPECDTMAQKSWIGNVIVVVCREVSFCLSLNPLMECIPGRIDCRESPERWFEVEKLRAWVRGQGRSEGTASKIVALLQVDQLLSEPRPRTWLRRGNFEEEDKLRYLWYRHAARLLGWKERQKFPGFVSTLLKSHTFWSHRVRDEAVAQEAGDGAFKPNPGVHARGGIGAEGPHHGEGDARHGGRGALPGSVGDTEQPVLTVPLELVTTAKRSGRPRKQALTGGNAMGEAAELAKGGVQV
ncbi:hypothetical protein KC19_12G000500 [Ceratodon purpureus]|uniref:Uncharacterized protein n=1 Tax=Ceratodon purpureus TaxID=3225 RepID=A0A8T0G7R4_CERPU|nr:hypothetical protein KC19_12G000500 [Ceratodon purpureus]